MKTLAELKQLADEDNILSVTIHTPWDQTSLARLYDHLNESFEKGALIDIVSAHPHSMDWANEIMEVTLVLDISDALDLPKDRYFSEDPEDAAFVEKYKKELGIEGLEGVVELPLPITIDQETSDRLAKEFGETV